MSLGSGGTGPSVNPANGLPMFDDDGTVDIAGNAFGTDSIDWDMGVDDTFGSDWGIGSAFDSDTFCW